MIFPKRFLRCENRKCKCWLVVVNNNIIEKIIEHDKNESNYDKNESLYLKHNIYV